MFRFVPIYIARGRHDVGARSIPLKVMVVFLFLLPSPFPFLYSNIVYGGWYLFQAGIFVTVIKIMIDASTNWQKDAALAVVPHGEM